MEKKEILEYYRRKGILNELLEAAENREVSATLSGGSYTSRPNILQYSSDVIKLVKEGAVSFHGSVERWTNPMELGTKLREEDFNRLRKGWDLILDIDSDIGFEASKITLKRILELIENYGIKNYGIKFSGRRGFHVGIPWQAFPRKVDFEPTSSQYPKIPRAISGYIRNEIKSDLLQDLIEWKGSYHELAETKEGFHKEPNPYAFVNADKRGLSWEEASDLKENKPYQLVEPEKDWGRRHLFRLPYSLHEKTWLVSYPLKKEEIDSFGMEDAKPQKIEEGRKFLKDAEKNAAEKLLEDAVGWMSKRKDKGKSKKEKNKSKKKIKPKKPVPEERFPPCIERILEGLPDGRKRSVFILITFLRAMKWDWNKIEEKLEEWNERNEPPLPDNYINTQLKWFKRQDRELISPSCDNDLYYKSFGVCDPDKICKQGSDEIQIKNPVVYPFKKKSD